MAALGVHQPPVEHHRAGRIRPGPVQAVERAAVGLLRRLALRAWWSGLQDHFHKIRFLVVETLEPGWSFLERRYRADERIHANRAASQQIDAHRILAGGDAGPDEQIGRASRRER